MTTCTTVSGMRIHYLDTGGAGGGEGAGEAEPPLLMIHGWAGAAADWEPLLRFLPARIRAIAVDLPGCGLSDKPDAPYDVPWFMGFLQAFCKVMGVERIILAGHSMGGQIAVHFAVRWPDMVEKLILVDPYGLKGEEGVRRPLSRLGPVVDLAFMLNSRSFIRRAISANILHNPSPVLLAAVVESTAVSVLGRPGARAIARVTRRVIGHARVDALLPLISAETLVVWGDHDKLLPPRWAEEFASRLPRATLRIIADAGHMPMLEKPLEVAELVASLVDGFLAQSL